MARFRRWSMAAAAWRSKSYTGKTRSSASRRFFWEDTSSSIRKSLGALMSTGAISPSANIRACNCSRGNSRTVRMAISKAVMPISRQATFTAPDFVMVTRPSLTKSGRSPCSGRVRPLRSRSIGRHSPSMAFATTVGSRLVGLIGPNNLLDEFVADDILFAKIHESNARHTAQDVLHFDQPGDLPRRQIHLGDIPCDHGFGVES